MADNGNGHLELPRWFLAVLAVFFSMATITFLPWTVWMTISVFEMRNEVGLLAKDIDYIKDAVKDLKGNKP